MRSIGRDAPLYGRLIGRSSTRSSSRPWRGGSRDRCGAAFVIGFSAMIAALMFQLARDIGGCTQPGLEQASRRRSEAASGQPRCSRATRGHSARTTATGRQPPSPYCSPKSSGKGSPLWIPPSRTHRVEPHARRAEPCRSAARRRSRAPLLKADHRQGAARGRRSRGAAFLPGDRPPSASYTSAIAPAQVTGVPPYITTRSGLRQCMDSAAAQRSSSPR